MMAQPDYDAIIADFKAEFCGPGADVLDAWFERDEFIVYYIDPKMLMCMHLLAVPAEYRGFVTIITQLPREEDAEPSSETSPE